MKRSSLTIAAVALATALFHAPLAAQGYTHPTLHINPRWKECSFQLSSSLTQSAWRQFTEEAGLVVYYRPLSDARPMGKGNFEVSVLQWKTGIDDHDDAWNDTFVHPDSVHWLFEGSGLAFPGLTVRAGVTARTDVGIYATKAPNANYGFYGAQVQRSLFETGAWAASARVSFVSMYGPEDLEFSVYGADLMASRTLTLSRRIALSPYVGVSSYLAGSHETTTAVALEDERVFGAHATAGAVMQLSRARLGLEYSVAKVPTLSMKVGFGT